MWLSISADEQVVRGRDGVEVAGEMQVDVFHRHDLGIAAAGRAALHAEAGTEARLAQADDRLLADAVEAVAEADGGGGLALARRRRADRGDEDQLAVRLVLQALDELHRDLGLGMAVGQQMVVRNAELVRDLADRLHRGIACDLDIAADLLVHGPVTPAALWFPWRRHCGSAGRKSAEAYGDSPVVESLSATVLVEIPVSKGPNSLRFRTRTDPRESLKLQLNQG